MKKALKYLAAIMAVLQILSFTLSISASEINDTSQIAKVLLENGQVIDETVTVSVDGEYELSVVWKTVDDSTQKIEYSVKIDEEYPFEGAKLLEAPVIFEDDGEVRTLSNGDQTAPKQKKTSGFLTTKAFDKTGVRLAPYTFYLSAGTHTIEIENLGDAFDFSGIILTHPEEIKTYKEVSAEYSGYKKYDGKQIEIEAENPLYRNDYSLTAKSDNGSVDISPKSIENSLINYIGGSTWSSPFQELVWEIDIPEDGLYKLGFNFKQNSIINGNAYRWLKIDGETPFAEATKLGFSYKTAWQYKDLEDANGEDYLFYLTKGNHTLSLSVTLAGVADIYDKLNTITAAIGDMYLDIVMITGETPDANRDYELYKQIPQFEEKLQSFYDELSAMSEELNTRKDINGQLDGAVKNMARVSKQMHDNRYESHLYAPASAEYEQNVNAITEIDYSERQEAVDAIVEKGKMNVNYSPKAVFEGKSSVLFNVKNIKNNHAPIVFEIYDEDDRCIYVSKKIEPGYEINSVELENELKKGVHDCKIKIGYAEEGNVTSVFPLSIEVR